MAVISLVPANRGAPPAAATPERAGIHAMLHLRLTVSLVIRRRVTFSCDLNHSLLRGRPAKVLDEAEVVLLLAPRKRKMGLPAGY